MSSCPNSTYLERDEPTLSATASTHDLALVTRYASIRITVPDEGRNPACGLPFIRQQWDKFLNLDGRSYRVAPRPIYGVKTAYADTAPGHGARRSFGGLPQGSSSLSRRPSVCIQLPEEIDRTLREATPRKKTR